MSIDTGFRPERAFDVQTSTIDSDLYLVRGTDAFRLGEVEREIWRLCADGNSVADIAARIADGFQVDAETALGDVRGFVEQLRDAGLVEEA